MHQYDGIDLEIVWETIKVDLVEVEKYVKDIYSKI
ncbi:HepT-like ribonuclease domain-containing protein [Halanaerobium salsuginis]